MQSRRVSYLHEPNGEHLIIKSNTPAFNQESGGICLEWPLCLIELDVARFANGCQREGIFKCRLFQSFEPARCAAMARVHIDP